MNRRCILCGRRYYLDRCVPLLGDERFCRDCTVKACEAALAANRALIMGSWADPKPKPTDGVCVWRVMWHSECGYYDDRKKKSCQFCGKRVVVKGGPI